MPSAEGASIGAEDDERGLLAPFERFVRRHIKAVDEFVRQLYPSVFAEPFVHAVFDRVEHRLPTGDDTTVRMQLFAEARALIRRQNREAWPQHNAYVVRERLREVGEVLSDWHAWADLNLLLVCLEQLPADQQEVLRLVSLYGEIGADELAVVLAIEPPVAARLLDTATAGLRTAYADGDPLTAG